MYGSILHFTLRHDHKNRHKTPSPVFLLMTKRASLSQNNGESVQYKLAQPACNTVLSCHQNRGRKTAMRMMLHSIFSSDFHFSRSVHNMYSRSNITNLVVGNGMLQRMPCVLMHIDVSSTSGNCIADTSLSLVHGIVQKRYKCSRLSTFL